MTTVAQMIEWMKTLPQDAEVECGVQCREYDECWMEMRPVNIEYCDVMDFTCEQDREKYPQMGGAIIVLIQGE